MNLSDFVKVFILREPTKEVVEAVKDPINQRIMIILWFAAQVIVSILMVFKMKDWINALTTLFSPVP